MSYTPIPPLIPGSANFRDLYAAVTNITGTSSPGIPLNSIQYNNPLGTFSGSSDLTFDPLTSTLSVGTVVVANGGITLINSPATVGMTETVILNSKQGIVTVFGPPLPAPPLPILATNTTSFVTINNTLVTETSLILLTIQNWLYNANGFPVVSISGVSNGSFNITIRNVTLDDINDGINIGYVVL